MNWRKGPGNSIQATTPKRLGMFTHITSHQQLGSSSYNAQLEEISNIRQQNANKDEMVGLDLDKSSHIKQKKLRSYFLKYKDKNFDGLSRSGTTHLKNHFKSCQRKTSGGGGGGAGGGEAAGNLTNPIAMIANHVILDQQLNHFCWRNMKFCLIIMIIVRPM
ncbi:hypothetical protein ACOSQ4_022253 [Xanthoceras sorbifolium]